MNVQDVERARQETPSCKSELFFDNAGAALMPNPVVRAVKDYLELEISIGGYQAREKRALLLDSAYDSIARLIAATPQEIALIENATRAWDMAFYSLPLTKGDVVLCCMSEYASNYIAMLQVAKKTGIEIQVIPNDEFGQISITALQGMITPQVKLIAVTHVPTNGGLVNPVREVGAIAKQHGITFMLDACQSIGQIPVHVNEINCDILTATGRKYLRAPRGTGFLYIKQSLCEKIEPVFLDLHAARWTGTNTYEVIPGAKRFENWEKNYLGIVGLGAAVSYALDWGISSIWSQVKTIAAKLRERLAKVPSVTIHDLGQEKCGIVSFSSARKETADICRLLRGSHVAVSDSNVFGTRLDMDARKLNNIVRASVHYYNTEEEIEQFCQILERILKS